MRRSLMNCQMIRVISSPSSSTTGPATLIFAMSCHTPDHPGGRLDFNAGAPAPPGQITRHRDIGVTSLTGPGVSPPSSGLAHVHPVDAAAVDGGHGEHEVVPGEGVTDVGHP